MEQGAGMRELLGMNGAGSRYEGAVGKNVRGRAWGFG